MIHRFSKSDGSVVQPGFNGLNSFRSDIEKLFPLVQVHDDHSADHNMAHSVAIETINISGALLDIYHRTDNNNFDKVWDEDANPSYWAPFQIKGFVSPKSIELALSKWGADAEIQLDIYFSIAALYNLYGERLVRIGDVINVPFNAIGNLAPKLFIVNNATPFGNYRYRWLYLMCSVSSIATDIAVVPRHGNEELH